jgi:fructose-1,6-bisphosphatase/inositol monophosphatase family enzyme
MEEYLDFAKKLTFEAQEIALRYFSFEVKNTWKEDNTPLTEADTEINDLVIKKINKTYPEHSIYGEEKSDIKENSKYIWVCDPIDGTMAFSCGLPIFVFSIALVDQSNGQPILGLINDPVMKIMYWACKGGGAYRNDKRIFVLKNNTFLNTYSLTGASGKDVGFSNLPVHKLLGEKKSRVMKFPSFIYGGIQVANGKFIGGVFYGKYGHDVAALKIITEEAGGKVTDLNGEERRYDQEGIGCIISNGILHKEILDIVQSGKIDK